MNSVSKRRPSVRRVTVKPAPPVSDLLLESLHTLAQTDKLKAHAVLPVAPTRCYGRPNLTLPTASTSSCID